MIPKIEGPAKPSSMDFIRVSSAPPPSRFPDPEAAPDFWTSYFRHPRHDLAEQVIALRRQRGLTQAELAERIGTKQPAVARIEAANANVGLDTVRSLAVALDAVVSIAMRPAEAFLYRVPMANPEARAEWLSVDLGQRDTAVAWLYTIPVPLLPVRSEPMDESNVKFAQSA